MRSMTHFAVRVLGFCVLGAAATLALAQEAAPAKPAVGTQMTPAQVYGKLLSGLEKEIVPAAEAMPEDKFNFVPTQGDFKGVNTFAEQVRHLAVANGFLFHDPSKPMADNSAELAKLKTKAEIVQALKDSFVQAHAFVDSMTAENAFGGDGTRHAGRDGVDGNGAHDGPLRTDGGVSTDERDYSAS